MALGHITASRSNVRSSRLTPADSFNRALIAQPSPLVEILVHYDATDLPDTLLQCTVQHSSSFRRDAIFSDLPGRVPVRAKDGSEYLLLSVYKNYIHVETLPNRSGPNLCAAYSATHTFFRQLGHQVKVQILPTSTINTSPTNWSPQTKNAPTPQNALFKLFAGTSSVSWLQLTPHSPSSTGPPFFPKLSSH
jgi:hypothetical protein